MLCPEVRGRQESQGVPVRLPRGEDQLAPQVLGGATEEKKIEPRNPLRICYPRAALRAAVYAL
eukprot:767036-Prorocentrum_lima.AAC.1